jgi:hypothetical protein
MVKLRTGFRGSATGTEEILGTQNYILPKKVYTIYMYLLTYKPFGMQGVTGP